MPLRAIATDAGVDALSFGGTKNGLLLGEAVVLLRPELADGFAYLRKQTLQLASKGRFLAAQFIALLEGDLWLRNAAHANAMAARLAGALASAPAVRMRAPVQANGVFAVLPPAATESCSATGASTSGTRRPGRYAGCAPGTRRPSEVDAFAQRSQECACAAVRVASEPIHPGARVIRRILALRT